MPPTLYIAVSGHGFGHIAQTAPVVDTLVRHMPGLHVVVRSAASAEVLRRYFHCPFEHKREPVDFGMDMASAVDVLAESSHRRYLALHRDWDAQVEREAERLNLTAPALVLADVPYITIAAAHRAGIPSVALCSLNWAAIYRAYCGDMAGADAVYEQMVDAYNRANLFLQPVPCMDMPEIKNGAVIGPIARIGRDRRDWLRARLGLNERDRLVGLFLGGIPTRLPLERWPRVPGVTWLVPQAWGAGRPDMFGLEAPGLSYVDVMRACDGIVTKPGYGSFTEAACNGVPVLYFPRPDWPEAPFLQTWLENNARCLAVERKTFERGDIGDALEALWSQAEKPRPMPTGIEDAVSRLHAYLKAARRVR